MCLRGDSWPCSQPDLGDQTSSRFRSKTRKRGLRNIFKWGEYAYGSHKPMCKKKINLQTFPEYISTNLRMPVVTQTPAVYVWFGHRNSAHVPWPEQREVRTGKLDWTHCRQEGGQCGFKPGANIHGCDWLPSSCRLASDRTRVPSRVVAGGGVQEGLVCKGCWEAEMPSGDGRGKGGQ